MKTWQKVGIGVGVAAAIGIVVWVSVNQANKGVVTVQTAKVAKVDTLVSQVTASELDQHVAMSADGEVLTGAADDGNAGGSVSLYLADRIRERIAHLGAHGVRMLRIVQRDDGDGLSVDIFKL